MVSVVFDLNDYDNEEILRNDVRDYVEYYTDVCGICNIGEYIDLKFNIDGDVIANEVKIREKWSNEYLRIKDAIEDDIIWEFEKDDENYVNFSVDQKVSVDISNDLLKEDIDKIIRTINYHRGYDSDSQPYYELSESLDKLFEEIIKCLENNEIGKAEKLSENI